MKTKEECIKNLQQVLISDKKIIFLLGAGCSCCAGIPDTKDILEKLESHFQKKEKFKKFKLAIDSIKTELEKNTYNIETLISVLQSKGDALANSTETLNKLNSNEFQELEQKIKIEIRKIIDSSKKKPEMQNNSHIKFVNWISGIPRKNCIEIFTTNYDCIIEEAFEQSNVPFYDGFSGSLNPFFDINSVENLGFIPEWSKLWKIHGSINWSYDKENNKIKKTKVSDDNDSLLIYPSNLKYQESRKLPYIAFIERLRDLLNQEAVLLTCGYSWQDEHINDTIINVLNKNPISSVFGFLHTNKISDSIYKLSQESPNISIYGTKQAIVNKRLINWEKDFDFTQFEKFVNLLSGDSDENIKGNNESES